MAAEATQTPNEEKGETEISDSTELPVKLDSLEVGGIRPKVKDSVDVTVTGTLTSIVDDCAYVKINAINDTDIGELLQDQAKMSKDTGSDEQDMMDMGDQMDAMGMPPGGPNY
jgi:hypothetical protein